MRHLLATSLPHARAASWRRAPGDGAPGRIGAFLRRTERMERKLSPRTEGWRRRAFATVENGEDPG